MDEVHVMDEVLVGAVQAQFDEFADNMFDDEAHDERVRVSGAGHWLTCADPTRGVTVSGIFDPSNGWQLSGRTLTTGGEPGDLLHTVTYDLADKIDNFGGDDVEDPIGAFYLYVRFSEALRDTDRQLRMRPLTQTIPGLVVDTAGGACPFQAEGTLHGLPFYFRYRSAHATLSLGTPGDPDFSYFAPLYTAGTAFGEEYDGWLTDEQFQTLFTDLVGQLARAPRLWEFDGAQVEDFPPHAPAGSHRTYGAWGFTPEEAYTVLVDLPAALQGTPKEQAAYLKAMALNPVTITTDERVWPDPEPVFTVNTPTG